MSTRRVPVVAWGRPEGGVTAVVAGDLLDAAATGASEAEAVRQLKELLEWREVHEPWNVDPDLADPVLMTVDVEVRPQYRVKQRLLPCRETVRMRVPCVTGRQESGLRLCVVPHLELSFTCEESADLRGLVAHYVREELHGLDPAELARRRPPLDARLLDLAVKTESGASRQRRDRADEPKTLSVVGEPLFGSGGRSRGPATAHGREALVETVAGLLGEQRANLLLVGEPGVGKSTLLAAAARRVTRRSGTAPEGGEEGDDAGGPARRFWRVSGGRIVAGMRYLGEWEERCEAMIEELQETGGTLVAENLLELLSIGGQGPGDSVAAFLLPYLERGELHLATEASPAEVEACRRLLPGLLDSFRVVSVPAWEESEALRVLDRIGATAAATAKVEIDPGAVALAYRLFRRYQPYLAFPGPTADFVRALVPRSGPGGGARRPRIGTDAVLGAFVQRTGLPEVLLRDDLPLEIDAVRGYFASRIVGQPEATDAAARVVTLMKAGLTDPARPAGVLLFCGPTGVGKTALARELVAYCFGAGAEKERLVRLDMSEYGDGAAAWRLMYDPRGGPASWVARVRRQPFCVVLLDEIEKAAPEVFDVLLSVLDEGRLTDRFGRVTWFRGALIVLTSNLGAGSASLTGFGGGAASDYEGAVARFFRPEFFNRLDAVVTFHALRPDDVSAIVRKELAELGEREGLAEAGLRFTWTDELVRHLAREGYDERFGARPLQRALERAVVGPLARWRLAHPRVRNVVLRANLGSDGRVTVEVGA